MQKAWKDVLEPREEKPIGRFESILSDQLGGVIQRVYLITLTEQD